MKKMVVITVVVMAIILMSVSIASANEDPIWGDVYNLWKKSHTEEYEMFLNTEYDSYGFAKNHIAYYASYSCSLWYDEEHSVDYIRDYFIKATDKCGIKDYTATVSCIGVDLKGRKVIELGLHTTMDLRDVKDAGFEQFEEPIYGMKMICYDRMYAD